MPSCAEAINSTAVFQTRLAADKERLALLLESSESWEWQIVSRRGGRQRIFTRRLAMSSIASMINGIIEGIPEEEPYEAVLDVEHGQTVTFKLFVGKGEEWKRVIFLATTTSRNLGLESRSYWRHQLKKRE